jgi:hypothetical protein
VWVKEYINSFSPTENNIRITISSFCDPLEPIGTNRTPWSIICDFTSLLGHEQLYLAIHLRCNNNTLFKMRKQVEKDLYLTSQLCKSMFIWQFRGGDVVHGPCLSDKDGYFDFAFTLHSRQWISIANQWATRSNCYGISSETQNIIFLI